MATVIDTLFIELGIDASKFSSEAQKATEKLEKMEKAFDKSEAAAKKNAEQAKKNEVQFKQLEKNIRDLVKAFTSFTSLALGSAGLTKLAGDAAQANREMDNLSRNLGMSRKELSSWQGAAGLAGGSADGLSGYLQTLSGSMTSLIMMGDTSMLPYFNALGVSMLDSSGKARQLDDVLLDLSDSMSSMDRVQAFNLARQMGMDDGTANMLLKGRQEMERLLAIQKELYLSSEQDIENSRKFSEQSAHLQLQWQSLTGMLGNALLPVLIEVTQLASGFMQLLIDNGEVVKAVFFPVAAVIGGVMTAALASSIGTVVKLAGVITGLAIPSLTAGATAAWAFIAPFLPAILAVTALGAAFALLYEDFMVWKQGGKSLFNWAWLETFKDGRVWINHFKDGLADLRLEIQSRLQPVVETFAKLWNQLANGDFKGAWETVKEGYQAFKQSARPVTEKALEKSLEAADKTAESKGAASPIALADKVSEQAAEALKETAKAVENAGNKIQEAAKTAVQTLAKRNAAGKGEMAFLPFIGGGASYQVTSAFGRRQNPYGKGTRQHNGVDYATPMGTVISAPEDGTISTNRHLNGGNQMFLVSADGLRRYAFAHLSEYLVENGQVKAGQQIAKTGNSGYLDKAKTRQMPTHLHVGMKTKNANGEWEYADPEQQHQWTGGLVAKGKANIAAAAKRAMGTKEAFVNQYGEVAKMIGSRLNVPAYAVLAQFALETGWGRSVIPGTNNLGNIKAGKSWKGKTKKAYDKMEKSNDPYRVYDSLEAFAEDYIKLIGNSARYKNVIGTKNAKEFFTALKAAGYATDPNYISSGTATANGLKKMFDFNTPLAGHVIASNIAKQQPRIDSSNVAGRHTTPTINKNTEVVMNGGVHIHTSASTMQGTGKDMMGGISEAVTQLNPGMM
ncbi:glucosaminidase domain-containing protein [Neisseria sp. S1]|uniref:glucosaminidase domain-containing protein n=1 Tax=Neisseria sp. S1 TaxID=3318354 RepID=UPI003A86DAFE